MQERDTRVRFAAAIQRHAEAEAGALAMGGGAKLAKRAAAGVLNARERIEYLVDAGSFEEVGRFATSSRPEDWERTPADAKICGYARIDGREVAIVSNDFTVLGASSSSTNRAKIRHMKRIATGRGLPLIFLGESSGARLPDNMGAQNMAFLGYPTQYLRQRETPWVSAILGPCYGSSALYGCMADFNVMRKGAVMALSSPRLLALATGERVDPETLGGWRVHAETTGLADMVVETDQEALDAVRRFLSYLPSHRDEPPPRAEPPDVPDDIPDLLDVIPESPQQVYDVWEVVRRIADPDSCFELKARFARNVVTTLARIDGWSVGIVANNPRYKGGALDSEASEKVTDFLVLCDSFNIPLIFLVDQPGFLIGAEIERRRLAGKVINWMNALSLCTVPKLSIVLRKSYGQAFLNMGGAGNSHEMAAWWTADISFMDPRAAVAIVHNLTADDDPAAYTAALAEMTPGNSAYDIARVFGVQTVLDPRDTRRYLKRMLEVHRLRRTGGVSLHLLSNWPTSY